MSDGRKKDGRPTGNLAEAGRPILRLVKAQPPETPTPPTPEKKPRPGSALVAFMTAYADAIDRDVKLLLEF